jgi:hypothetical protein
MALMRTMPRNPQRTGHNDSRPNISSVHKRGFAASAPAFIAKAKLCFYNAKFGKPHPANEGLRWRNPSPLQHPGPRPVPRLCPD